MWNEAAYLYNKAVMHHLSNCTQSGAVDKQYRGATTGSVLETFFQVHGRHLYARLHRVPEGGGGPQPEVRVSHLAGKPRLAKEQVATLGKNQCRREIRSRGGTCANNVQTVELRQKLKDMLEGEESCRAP